METSTTANTSETAQVSSAPSSVETAPSSTSGTTSTAGATSAASTTATPSEDSDFFGSMGEMDAGQWLGVIALGAVPIIGPLLQAMEITNPGSITGNKGSSPTPTSTEPVATEQPVATDATTALVEASSSATSTVDASVSVPPVSGMTAEGAEFMAA